MEKQITEFSFFANTIYEVSSSGLKKEDFCVMLFTELTDDSIDIIALYENDVSWFRFIQGTRSISALAKKIQNHICTSKFEKYIRSLKKQQISDIINRLISKFPDLEDSEESAYPFEIANLFKEICLRSISKTTKKSDVKSKIETDIIHLQKIEEISKKLSSPKQIKKTTYPTNDESKYIDALLESYADDSQLSQLRYEDLPNYPEYEEDMDDRRIDYYAAESIRRSCFESNNDKQFEILKLDVFDRVKDIARRRYDSGYERMLEVMSIAANLTVTAKYYLGLSPNWLSSQIKKGVCHHLVNDDKLKWVKK